MNHETLTVVVNHGYQQSLNNYMAVRLGLIMILCSLFIIISGFAATHLRRLL